VKVNKENVATRGGQKIGNQSRKQATIEIEY